jgi:bifunctional DNA-binding transcriptional regulator/antitoxin component of YhaV-PrlF toxin-antitoxin module
MAHTDKRLLSVERLGAKGQLTIPAEYRRALALGDDTSLAIMQVGDALVIAPYDEALTAITARLEAAMDAAHSNVDELIHAAEEARAEIVHEEFDLQEEH